MAFLRIFFVALLLVGCGSNHFSRVGMRIGIDPLWYPKDFGTQTSYVNGYIENLLLEMNEYSGVRFEIVQASWDNLLDGLKEKKYDAIITTLPPHEYHLAKYDFSDNLLSLGPVLIVPTGSSKKDLDVLGGDLVGIIMNDPAALILEKHPEIVIREFQSIPDLLGAVTLGKIDAALLDRIPAVNYIDNLYAGMLEIPSKPLNNAGIRLVGPKGEIDSFNRSFKSLKKKGDVKKLQKKWELAISS